MGGALLCRYQGNAGHIGPGHERNACRGISCKLSLYILWLLFLLRLSVAEQSFSNRTRWSLLRLLSSSLPADAHYRVQHELRTA